MRLPTHCASDLKVQKTAFAFSLCSPVLMPHICGGLVPSGFETLKVSVRHLVKAVAGIIPISPMVPEFFTLLVTEVVTVLGPVMIKFEKSKRNWKDNFF